jgi:hypothetical protein
MRALFILGLVATLAGCYNPRYPSEVPGDRALPQETGNSQETSVRERRDGAAASGTTTGRTD